MNREVPITFCNNLKSQISNFKNGSLRHLVGLQGLKPLIFIPLDDAAEAATHNDYKRDSFISNLNRKLRITNHELQVTNHKSRTANYESRITSHKLRVTNHNSRASLVALCSSLAHQARAGGAQRIGNVFACG